MKCTCEDWSVSWWQVMKGIDFLAAHTRGEGYEGKQFLFCQWCGSGLVDDRLDMPSPHLTPEQIAERKEFDRLKPEPREEGQIALEIGSQIRIHQSQRDAAYAQGDMEEGGKHIRKIGELMALRKGRSA